MRAPPIPSMQTLLLANSFHPSYDEFASLSPRESAQALIKITEQV
jgi:hypothetical protein